METQCIRCRFGLKYLIENSHEIVVGREKVSGRFSIGKIGGKGNKRTSFPSDNMFYDSYSNKRKVSDRYKLGVMEF